MQATKKPPWWGLEVQEMMVYEIVWFIVGLALGVIGYAYAWPRRGAIMCALKSRHDWAYAQGKGKGAISGEVRPLCFRRACTRCGKIQEISHYDWLPYYVGKDGVKYRQKPIWITPEE